MRTLNIETPTHGRVLVQDAVEAAAVIVGFHGYMEDAGIQMQRLADILDAPVERPTVLETTALGAAYLAGLQCGLYPAPEVFAQRWALDRHFAPGLASAARARMLGAWHRAVRRTLLESGPRPT